MLGALPRRVPVAAWAPLLPELGKPEEDEDAQDIQWDRLGEYERDQNGQGSCVAFAATEAAYVASELVTAEWPGLSAGHLYGRINGGLDAGAYLTDALHQLLLNGCAPRSLVPDLEWHPRNWPPAATTLAHQFRLIEVYDCPTWEKIVHALLHGWTVCAAIDIGRNFTVGPDNWVMEKRGTAGGHALCLVGTRRHPTTKKRGVIAQNSWGPNWGHYGTAVIPQSYFDGTFNDAWAVRALTWPEYARQNPADYMTPTPPKPQQPRKKPTPKPPN
jgi:hypothetical protein